MQHAGLPCCHRITVYMSDSDDFVSSNSGNMLTLYVPCNCIASAAKSWPKTDRSLPFTTITDIPIDMLNFNGAGSVYLLGAKAWRSDACSHGTTDMPTCNECRAAFIKGALKIGHARQPHKCQQGINAGIPTFPLFACRAGYRGCAFSRW